MRMAPARSGSRRTLAGDLVAVHAGQADVEQDDVGAVVAGGVDRVAAVVGDADVVALDAEQPGHRAGGVGVVVDDQDPGPGPRRVARRRAARRRAGRGVDGRPRGAGR